MLRNYFLINLLLLITIAALGFRFHSILTTRLEIPDSPSHVESGMLKIKTAFTEQEAKGDNFFEVISDKNLFHPSRSALRVSKEEPQAAINTNEFQLFGTTIMSHRKIALIEDPGSKKTKLYYLNDRIQGFTVSDIFEDRVVLQKEGELVELRLRTDKKYTNPSPIRTHAASISKQVKRPQPSRRRAQRRPQRTRPGRYQRR